MTNKQYNQEHADLLSKEHGSVREAYENTPWGRLSGLFKCTNEQCDTFVGGPTMKFYNYDHQSVRCYDCQK